MSVQEASSDAVAQAILLQTQAINNLAQQLQQQTLAISGLTEAIAEMVDQMVEDGADDKPGTFLDGGVL